MRRNSLAASTACPRVAATKLRRFRMRYTILSEALEPYRTRQDEIDLVLTDMIMPEMGGEELYDELTQINPQVEVLLVSEYSLKNRVPAMNEQGLNGFLQKPFDLEELAQTTREVLDSPKVPEPA